MTENERMKVWIDEASYEDLLRKWRFASVGSLWFQGEMGDYYAKVMAKKRDETADNGVSASKAVGW